MPSFKGRNPISEKSSAVKSRNKSKATKHEMLLRRELRKIGVRFKTNVISLPGKPDIVFADKKLVVFCDGDFWHGKGWPVLRKKLEHGANSQYWIAKIMYNRRRDLLQTLELKRDGWRVVRIWESEIIRNPNKVCNHLIRILSRRRVD